MLFRSDISLILAALEDEGYVRQPHTSAGRVPTDLGYRLYVDLLLEGRRSRRTATAVEARLRREAGAAPLMDQVLSNVSHVLSHASRHVGFALAPANNRAVLNRIEFISLGASKVLVIVVAGGGQVTQKVVDIGEPLRPEELRHAATYLNTEFAGLPLANVRGAIVARLRQERTLADALLSRALLLARRTLDDLSHQNTLFVEGASSLLEEATHHDSGISMTTVRTLLKMVEQKQRLVRLLNEYIDGPGLTVVIGGEHTAPDLRPFSLIASTYFDGVRSGTVGVIGPTRMRYSRAIEVVAGVALAVSRVLRDTE